MLAGLIFATLMGTTVEIHSELSCPEATIRNELLQVGLDSSMDGMHDRVRLKNGAIDEVILELITPDGEALGSRTFSPPFTCDEVARAIALTVAIWESNVHPEYTPVLAERQREAPVAPVQEIAAPTADRPVLTNVDVRQAAPGASRTNEVPDPFAADFEIGAGASLFESPASGSGDAEGIALGIGIVGIHRPRAWPLGLWLSGNIEENRAMSLLLGSAEWRRTRANLGVLRSVRVGGSPFFIDGRGGIAAARLTAKGVGFATNFTANSFDLGVEGGLRLSMRHKAFVPWIDFSIVRWLSSDELLQSDPDSGRRLPDWLFGLTLGMSLGWKTGG
jgi:hypothetical protein